MADITATIKEDAKPHSFQDPIETRIYTWDPVGSGTAGIATHNLVAIPAGYALLDAWVIVTTAFAGASGTYQFKTAEANWTGAVTVAAMTAGEIIHLDTQLAITATVGSGQYVDGTTITEETIDVAIATTAATAGKAKIVVRLLNVAALMTKPI